MNTQLEAIQSLIRINRDAMRELAKVAETTSADYVHIDNAMRMLGEQFHILLQQKEELETTVITTERRRTGSSRAREFHPHPLTEPCVKVSPHTALHTLCFVHMLLSSYPPLCLR